MICTDFLWYPTFLFQEKPVFSYICHFTVRTKRIFLASGTLIAQTPQEIDHGISFIAFCKLEAAIFLYSKALIFKTCDYTYRVILVFCVIEVRFFEGNSKKIFLKNFSITWNFVFK